MSGIPDTRSEVEHPVSKQHEGYIGTNLEPRSDDSNSHSYRGFRVATPNLMLRLQPSAPHQRKDVWPLGIIQRATGPTHGGSSGEAGFQTLTLLTRSPTTISPRSFSLVLVTNIIIILVILITEDF
ncbi:hypothetical protein AVEN_20063-1 [Araneus ventricosus]|uniref:Uncharacterized protein n=1 Tax=Araneus ventricosus TaxID=182803 RepID=A0A4Y2JXZ6_ARAVE|nr:hypothetical protein AVEN_20063-1 [Araneus ventricosus]